MQLDNRLGQAQRQQQQLALNADLLQSLEVLRLPIQELREAMLQKSYDNPLLEAEDSPEPPETAQETPAPPAEPQDADEANFVQSVKNDIWSAGAAGGETYLAAGGSEQSFTEMLGEQVGALSLNDGFAALCRYIVACLDRRGYFLESPDEVARLLGCTTYDVMQALYLVQSLEPAGVGARSLEECLLLQLMHSRHFNQYTIRLVKDGLPLLAAGDMKELAALLCLPRADTLAVCGQVRALCPIPSQGYYTGEAPATVVPDASVEKTAAGFTAVYNRRLLPTLTLNAGYVAMAGGGAGGDVQAYLRRNLADARQFMRAVEKREDTFTRIVGQIISMQPAYFEDGKTLTPMTMEAVAAGLGLNTSTVSRAIQGKYVKCAAGTVELRTLFTTGVKNHEGELVSAVLVKRSLEGFIHAEDAKRPLSDEDLCQALKVAGVNISRRTVAKYREELGIPASSRRRRP